MRWRMVIPGALASLALGAGCDAVLGLSTTTLAPQDGGDELGVREDSSGGSSSGGSSGSSSGAGSSSGSGSGSSGSSSGGDAAAVCGQDTPTGAAFQQTVASCVLTISCDPGFYTHTISECISRNLLSAYGQSACLSTIQDCPAYTLCTGQGIPSAAECPAGKPSDTCKGNTEYICTGNTTGNESVNCSKYGATCKPGSGGVCVVVPTCTNKDHKTHCTDAGDIVYQCFGGVGYGVNCALEDSTCDDFFDAGSYCYTNGPKCNRPGVTCTDAGDLSLCSADDLRQTTFSCPTIGLGCDTSPSGDAGICTQPGCSLTSPCPGESCGTDGKTLTVCAGGAPLEVDCTKVGDQKFTGCAVTTSQDGVVFAYCIGGTGAAQ